jgi:Coenzyme PQQ synthesis protein D (PqqD)
MSEMLFQIKKSSTLIAQEVDGDYLVYNHITGAFHKLNSIGKIIFSRIDDWTPTSDIVDILHEKFSIEKHIIEKDVFSFVDQMSTRGLIDTK